MNGPIAVEIGTMKNQVADEDLVFPKVEVRIVGLDPLSGVLPRRVQYCCRGFKSKI